MLESGTPCDKEEDILETMFSLKLDSSPDEEREAKVGPLKMVEDN